jgi:hypothetical protein
VERLANGVGGAAATEQGPGQQQTVLDGALGVLRGLAQWPDRELRLARSKQCDAVQVVQLGIVGREPEQLAQGLDRGVEPARPLALANLLQASLRIEPARQGAHGDPESEPAKNAPVHRGVARSRIPTGDE